MLEKTREVPQLVDATYAHTLVIESTFDNQSMSIGCVGKLGHRSGFLRHYLLILPSPKVSLSIFTFRLKIRGMKHIIFYELPLYSHLYSEMCNLIPDPQRSSRAVNYDVTVLYTK